MVKPIIFVFSNCFRIRSIHNRLFLIYKVIKSKSSILYHNSVSLSQNLP